MNRNTSPQAQHYNRANWHKRRSSPRALSGYLVGLLMVGTAGSYFATELQRPVVAYAEPQPLIREDELVVLREIAPPTTAEVKPDTYYPVGEFLSNPNRGYQDGSMELFIPKLELLCAINGAADQETLLNGPGLIDYAQLPGPMEQNANVSIAGNRDIGNSEFALIDQLGEGDLMYLRYNDTLYTYEYTETIIRDQFFWDPLCVQEFPCLTLQSCTPSGAPRETQDRIFVVGRLVEVQEGIGFPAEEQVDIPVEEQVNFTLTTVE